MTRPDSAYVDNILSQLLHCPTDDHWTFVKCILRYLCGTIDHGLTFHHHSPLHLHAYNAFIIYLGRNPISWSSKKQRTVARSSTEVKYRSIAATPADLRWISNLLGGLGYFSTQTPTTYCDNVGATNLFFNPVFHLHMKHVALDYHFILKQVQNDDLRVTHVTSVDHLQMPSPNL